jgi:hypothetical protein
MKTVSSFEANLLRLLQHFLQRAPAPKLRSEEGFSPPTCLSRAAVELLQDHLGKGTMLFLAREGWRKERFLGNGQVRAGRLWERWPPAALGLVFTGNTVEFLLQITALLLGDKKMWRPETNSLGSGDRLLLFLAFQAVRQGPVHQRLSRHDYFVHDGLCRLAFPESFTETQVVPDWKPWMTGATVSILEALQHVLYQRWLEIEERKEQIASWQQMRALGQSQERALRSFSDALAQAGRWDLARFLLRALSALLRSGPAAQRWTANLDVRGLRLADRLEAYKAALSFVGYAAPLQQWTLQARNVGYFDEGYAASQLWKADWEACQGDEVCRQAQLILREIEPLGTSA